MRSMETFGWKGRPIVVGHTDKGLLAFTGNHRYAAAKEVGIRTIPVIMMTPDEVEVALEAGAFQDYRIGALIEAGHKSIGEFMYMDSLIVVLMGEDIAQYPWDDDALAYYKRQGIRQEVIDVMGVEDWC